ncbi:alpha/beta hydrolase fold domain-containing protein [Spirillospora sp. CA-294931]|uniref:alpha/beta hydrolase fold domain-containing protein n=1 Tax=Spirillospora sp. CA-294931 TaxID=3240042 RepID=UPI003D8D3FEE
MTTSTRPASIRPVATTAAERRVTRVLAMEPGSPASLQARLVNVFLRRVVMAGWEATPDSEAGLLMVQRVVGAVGRVQRAPRGVSFSRDDLGTCSAQWIRAPKSDERKVFLYLHGGGYFCGGPGLYKPFSWRLAAATGRPVFLPDYRLAPKHSPADALEDALAAYDRLLDQGYDPSDIAVGGDSAGGHLVLALLLALKERGTPLPAATVCISPWADLMCESESHKLNARGEPLLSAARLASVGRRFCRDKQENDPVFSPWRGDLTGLPPMLLMSSLTEILRDDTRAVARRARESGVDVVLQEWDGLVHAFPVFADLVPEGRASFRHIAEFLRSTGA